MAEGRGGMEVEVPKDKQHWQLSLGDDEILAEGSRSLQSVDAVR